MASQPGQKTIAIYILPNISRNKGKQTIKFGQLKEYMQVSKTMQKMRKED